MGPANTAPDSRTPRRFANASSTTSTTAITTVYLSKNGNAEVIAAVPADTDTATVST